MSDKSEIELISNCHGATETNGLTAFGFYSMVELLEHLKRANKLVTALSMDFFPEELENEQKN